MQNFITVPDGITPYDLTLNLNSGGKIRLQGDLTLTPLTSEGAITIDALELRPLWEYVQQDVDFTLKKGQLSFRTHYRFAQQQEQQSLYLLKSQLQLSNFQLRTHDAEKLDISLPALSIKGLSLDYQADTQQQSILLQNPMLNLDKLAITATGNVHYAISINNLALAKTRFEMSDDPKKPYNQLKLETFTISQLRIGEAGKNPALIHIPNTSLHETYLDINKNQLQIASLKSDSANIMGWLDKNYHGLAG